jgi:hypothetical protein
VYEADLKRICLLMESAGFERIDGKSMVVKLCSVMNAKISTYSY